MQSTSPSVDSGSLAPRSHAAGDGSTLPAGSQTGLGIWFANLSTRARAGVELGAVILLYGAIALFGQFGYNGPVAILASVVLITVFLRLRQETWLSLGLRWPKGWGGLLKGTGYALLVTAAAPIVAAIVTPFITAVLGEAAERTLPDVSTLSQYLVMMVIVWTTAAIGEELLFRGFLMTRIADLFGRGRLAWAASLVLAASVFGLLHAYQGPAGMLLTGSVGLMFGAFYLLGRRNLLPLIVAHGLVNTLGITVLHLQATGAIPAS